jgi:hypothetical protein
MLWDSRSAMTGSPVIRKTMVFVLIALFLGQYGAGMYDLVFSNFCVTLII